MIRTLFLALLAVVFVSPVAQAAAPDVGAAIPSITAKDQHGKEQSFDTLKGKNGITLVFIRSVEWCPFCQRQVMELDENAAKFKDAGYPVVIVSYDAPEKLAAFHSKLKNNTPMLSDPRSDIIKAFGIFNENYAKGTMAYGTPYPGTFVVGADQKIKAKFFKDGVQDRVSVSDLLASMKPEPAPMDPAEEFPQEETPAVTTTEPVMDTPVATEEPAQEMLAPAETMAPVAPETPVAPDLVSPHPMVAPAPTAAPAIPEAPVVETPVVETPAVTEPTVPEAAMPVVPEAPAVEEPSIEFIPPTEEDMPADSSQGGL